MDELKYLDLAVQEDGGPIAKWPKFKVDGESRGEYPK